MHEYPVYRQHFYDLVPMLEAIFIFNDISVEESLTLIFESDRKLCF